MYLFSSRVSLYLIVFAIISYLQICNCAESDDGGAGVVENSVEEENEEVPDHDDKLISQLLDAPIGSDHDSEVARILKILEAAEQATSTTTSTTTTTTTTTTTPKPTTTPTTTESPFFKTERPSKYSSRVGKPDDLDEMIAYLDKSFKEAEQELGSGDEFNGTDTNGMQITKRSDYHHHHLLPPFNSLVWNTAQAVWDVSRPVFYKTKVGRKVSLAQDTFSLPLRTLGAIRHKIHDLYHHPHSYDRKHRSVWHGGWDHHDGHHYHHHGHGWGDAVYVKYEPDNSLFKSWLRYLYRAIRPAVITKFRLKRQLLWVKLRLLAKLVSLLKHVKIQKVFTAIRAFTTKLQLLKSRLRRPNVVVIKDHHHDDYPHHHHGWGGWPSPAPPPPPPPSPKPVYGPPKYQAPAPVYTDMSYGPPEMNTYGGYQAKTWSDSQYGPPQATTKQAPSPIAYNQANTYSNYQAPPSQWLTAPESMMAQSSEPLQSSSSAAIEVPSYAKYLEQFGINPANLADTNTPPPEEAASNAKLFPGIRNLRSNTKNSEEVPYLMSESGDDQEQISKMDGDESLTGRSL